MNFNRNEVFKDLKISVITESKFFLNSRFQYSKYKIDLRKDGNLETRTIKRLWTHGFLPSSCPNTQTNIHTEILSAWLQEV